MENHKTLEYSTEYYKRIVIKYDLHTKEYITLRFIGYVEKYLNIVFFPDGSLNVYYVFPTHAEEIPGDKQELTIQQKLSIPLIKVGKTLTCVNGFDTLKVKNQLLEALPLSDEDLKLFLKDFLSPTLTKVSEAIFLGNFPEKVYD